MELLFLSGVRAIKSVFAPGMFLVFIQSLLITLLALVGFVILSGIAFDWLALSGFIVSWFPWVGTLGSVLIAWVLFPGIMPIIINFFDDRIATLIERDDYPAVIARQPDFWPELWHDVRFSLKAILLNIIVLPLYLVPVINLFLFYALNGYLLGKEFFVMVARRHIALPEAKALRAQHSRKIFIAGVGLAILATIPIINLLAPFWGIAVMVHMYHGLKATPEVLAPSNNIY